MSARASRLLCAILAGLAIACAFAARLGHDQAWYLYAASRILEGARPYRDLVDPNLPTVSLLSLLPAWLAARTGWSAIAWFQVCVLALAAGLFALCARLLRSHVLPAQPAARRALLPVLIASFGLAPFGLRGLDFGQREHLALCLLTPYVLAHAARCAGRPLAAGPGSALALLAAAGLALKPHFALVWLSLELWTLSRASTRPGFFTAPVLLPPLLLGAYGVLCLALLPELRQVGRLALAVYPSYREGSYLNMLGYPDALLGLGALALHGLVAGSGRLRDLRRSLALSLAAWWILAFAQRGWDYHFLPAAATAVLLGSAVLLDLERPARQIAAVLAGGLLVGGLWSAHAAIRSRGSPAVELGSALAQAAGGEAVWVVSTSGWPAFPAVLYGGLRWASRFPCLWFLPGLYPGVDPLADPFPYHAPAERSGLESGLLDALIGDLARFRPGLVLVDIRPWQQGFGRTSFDYLSYLGRDERFVRLWCGYVHRTRWRDWLDVYERDPARAAACAGPPGPGAAAAPSAPALPSGAGLVAMQTADTPKGRRTRATSSASSR